MIQHFKAARNAAAPMVAIETPDQTATVQEIAKALSGEKQPPPMFTWDVARGILPANKASTQALGMFGSKPNELIRCDDALVAAQAAREDTILFLYNAHRFLGSSSTQPPDASCVQALTNLRDIFKSNGRMVVLLSPSIRLPAELETDTLILSEPLPDDAQLGDIVESVYNSAEMKPPKGADLAKIVDALSGLAAFPAEQAVAMCLRKSGIDVGALWERKRQMVEQARGLSVWRGDEKYDSIGGLENIKRFNRALIKGKRAPKVIVFLDEIEKYINPDGDLSGVQKDQLGVMLSFMQDNNAMGEILVGPPGTCKSAFAKATGNEAGCPTVALDLGGAKAGIVGESEANIRHALKVCKAIGGDRMLFIATSNNIGNLPPELRRRYTLGTFFMDLPDSEERAMIWALYLKAYKLDAKQAKPADEGWTGAEIKQCCDLADSLGIPLTQAAEFIVPVARSSAEKIDTLRKSAAGRYISASKAGLYTVPSTTAEAAAPAPASGGSRRMREIN